MRKIFGPQIWRRACKSIQSPLSLGDQSLAIRAFNVANLILLMNNSLGDDLVSLVLHSFGLFLLWFTARINGSSIFAKVRYLLGMSSKQKGHNKNFPGYLSGASVLMASLMNVRVGARLNFLQRICRNGPKIKAMILLKS